MSNIAVNREPNPQPTVQPRAMTREWEPFRMMRELLHWDPLGAMTPGLAPLEPGAFAPTFDVKETKEGFVFTADVPGVKDNDLDVRITQNRLSISGKRESEKVEKTDQFYATERSYGSFTRTFTLPAGVLADKIQAELKAGVLTVLVPRAPEAQPKKIDVASK